METSNPSFDSLAKGTLLGALCGDAIGGVLEHKPVPNSQEIEAALNLPGGGCHKLGRGQVTDDGELTLCLLQGLADGGGKLNLNTIATYYGKWIQSPPFDIGGTTRNALPKACNMKEHQAEMVRRGAKNSVKSQSNGCLMRMSPLCIWGARLKLEDLLKAVREESILTHPNETCIASHLGYAGAIHHLLNNAGDYKGAYETAVKIVRETQDKDAITWIEELEKEEMPVVNRNGGWAKIAFLYTLFYLKNNFSYVDAMKDILSKGGDTDTNCCIIGAVIGALHGVEGIPEKIRERVLEFDSQKENGVKRPAFLTPKHVAIKYLDKMLAILPKELVFVGDTSQYLNQKKK